MRTLSTLSLLTITACVVEPERDPEYRPVTAGAPVVGAAEAPMGLPVGTPLGGYTHRIIGVSGQDARDSAYTWQFAESTGVQLQCMIKVVWLHNGDDHLIWVKADLPYSYDQLAWEASTVLAEQLGMELDGKVVVSTSHSHHSYGPFTDQYSFYLGGDKYNEEVYQRLLGTIVETATEAWNTRQDAALAVGWAKDWDPDDLAYRDRRGENDDLLIWEDQTEPMGKDPWLGVWRVDAADGSEPIATVIHYGFHPYALADDNSMASADGTGALEQWVQDHVGGVVMQVQAGAGDISIAGSDDNFAQAESIGEVAGPTIVDLHDQLVPSTDPLELEVWTSSYRQSHQGINVTRDGTVDWRYAELTDAYEGDDVIYGEDGEILSPIDEFNAPDGAVLCGDGENALISGGGVGSLIEPYVACVVVDELMWVMEDFFAVPEEELELPLHESRSTQATIARIGGLPTLTDDGSPTEEEVLIGFFPGETTSLYLEQWRRYASTLGYDRGIGVGYSQDHEGYLLLTEDWLAGGYEPNINLWGPLQADYIMESMVTDAEDYLSTDVHEPLFPLDRFLPIAYIERDLPDEQPDTTEEAGTRITGEPDYIWTPLDVELDLSEPDELPRVQGIAQLAWYGGDPAVDIPRVTLQRQDDSGAWQTVTNSQGVEITEVFSDILLAHTPDPLAPSSAEQQHQWWAGWQVVSHVQDRAGVPEGTYRLHVSGQRYTGGNASWPWSNVEVYEVEGPAFTVVPASLDVALSEDGVLTASLPATEQGYRLVHLDGSSIGANPIDEATVTITLEDSSTTEQTVSVSETADGWSVLEVSVPDDAIEVWVTDAHGNEGGVDLTSR